VNQATLAAQLVERQVLRFTPAGVPVSDLKIAHQSQVMEAGQTRTVGFEMQAIALGDLAYQTQAAPLQARLKLTGFLAPRSKQSKTLVFHITGLETIQSSTEN
jgi:primosomal replication protein N